MAAPGSKPTGPRPDSESSTGTRARERLTKALAGAFTRHLPLKAAALFFALVLWLVVSATEPSEHLVEVRFTPLLDSSLTLLESPPTVQALVIGRTRELLQLYATPPAVRRRVDAEVPDTVTIELRPTDVDMPAGIDAIVRDVQPRRITLRFASAATRVLPVRSALRFRGDSGLRISGAPRFEPDSVRVTGDRHIVGRLDAIPTVAMDLVVRDSQPVLVPLDTAELGVSVRPARVRVAIDVTPAPPAPDTTPASTASRPAQANLRDRRERGDSAP